ncbi:EVE domain-containing protein [Thalassotalea mangrovi]|uniref:EVE domain-containing protein n=1 Tax=Thalassotalea mangrovi TaxID=2572245 RepID=A0A4U1B511_9GAMM|nr:EVE domain-containing protein [Thalassotalea mangrovi]TKB45503.1 EVE domain-containing protein [Thalassotalea mangrovi]
MNYWLFKTEPDEFSIDDLAKTGADGECWEGIRNYQARNFMRDKVEVGDKVFIYHSSCKDVGIAGIGEIVKEAFPDPFQFNPTSKYYDEKSTEENPRWVAVQVGFVEKFDRLIPLSLLKQQPQLEDMILVNRGRLSIQPVEEKHWQFIIALRNKT